MLQATNADTLQTINECRHTASSKCTVLKLIQNRKGSSDMEFHDNYEVISAHNSKKKKCDKGWTSIYGFDTDENTFAVLWQRRYHLTSSPAWVVTSSAITMSWHRLMYPFPSDLMMACKNFKYSVRRPWLSGHYAVIKFNNKNLRFFITKKKKVARF